MTAELKDFSKELRTLGSVARPPDSHTEPVRNQPHYTPPKACSFSSCFQPQWLGLLETQSPDMSQSLWTLPSPSPPQPIYDESPWLAPPLPHLIPSLSPCPHYLNPNHHPMALTQCVAYHHHHCHHQSPEGLLHPGLLPLHPYSKITAVQTIDLIMTLHCLKSFNDVSRPLDYINPHQSLKVLYDCFPPPHPFL